MHLYGSFDPGSVNNRHSGNQSGRELSATWHRMHKPDHQPFRMQVDCETIIKEGDAREVICSFVLEYEPDLLIVGSRGPATILNRSVTMPITS
jgi:hypothetical protein